SYKTVKKIFHYLSVKKSKTKPSAGFLLKHKLVFLKPSDRVGKAVRIMRELGYSQLPVLAKGKNMGSLNEQKIGNIILKYGRTSAVSMEVSEIMESPFSEIEYSTPAESVYPLVLTNNAVLVKKSGKITGILTKSDFL
ncbi:CBS domain-containing protein, partial [Candidatus Micrarchaeota archaeon]|nr:CBS domain-containing protein [Candidatus Micrarchaeota archaeon]